MILPHKWHFPVDSRLSIQKLVSNVNSSVFILSNTFITATSLLHLSSVTHSADAFHRYYIPSTHFIIATFYGYLPSALQSALTFHQCYIPLIPFFGATFCPLFISLSSMLHPAHIFHHCYIPLIPFMSATFRYFGPELFTGSGLHCPELPSCNLVDPGDNIGAPVSPSPPNLPPARLPTTSGSMSACHDSNVRPTPGPSWPGVKVINAKWALVCLV